MYCFILASVAMFGGSYLAKKCDYCNIRDEYCNVYSDDSDSNDNCNINCECTYYRISIVPVLDKSEDYYDNRVSIPKKDGKTISYMKIIYSFKVEKPQVLTNFSEPIGEIESEFIVDVNANISEYNDEDVKYLKMWLARDDTELAEIKQVVNYFNYFNDKVQEIIDYNNNMLKAKGI